MQIISPPTCYSVRLAQARPNYAVADLEGVHLMYVHPPLGRLHNVSHSQLSGLLQDLCTVYPALLNREPTLPPVINF